MQTKDYKTIPLTRGKYAIVDLDDFNKFGHLKWHAKTNGYVARAERIVERGKASTVYLHRVIMSARKGQQIDHINGDMLDNRKCNLRVCTNAQNSWNRRLLKNASGYKGVYASPRKGYWVVYICVNYRRIFLGTFNSVYEAARTYNNAALKYYGEFAKLNQI